jgi:hypothetical protein
MDPLSQADLNPRTPRHLSRTEAAEFLTANGYPVAKTTLQKYATVGGGPIYRKFGRRVVYLPENLLSWAESRLSCPVSSSTELGRESSREGEGN